MNYNHFLNRNTKFKNKNHYRLDTKKKNTYKFLLFSIVSAAILTTVVTLGMNKEDTSNPALELTINSASKHKSNTQSATETSPSATVQHIALDLPEIGYRSEVLSQSVIYSEVETSEAEIMPEREGLTVLELSKKEAATLKTEPVLLVEVTAAKENNATIDSGAPAHQSDNMLKITPQTVTKQALNRKITASLLNKVETPETAKLQKLITPLQTNTIKTKTVVVKKGDTLSAIFKRLSLSSRTLYQIINSSKQAKQLTRIRPGQKLFITYDNEGKLQSLQYELDRIDTLVINKKANNSKFASHIDSKEIEIRQQFATGTISNSLFAAGNKAGLNSAMIMKLAQLFGWDVDFALDIRKGDSFAVLFEEKYVANKKVGTGNILSAEFVNKGKIFQAIRYTDASGHTDYYSEKGLSMRKAFLRTPVQFSRISSRFSNGRKHPVLNKIRAHKGVDYAASRGTPIRSVGNGKVIFKGRKGGYGRVIILQHGSKYTTLYAHMKSYNRKIKKGSRVEQGQIIGYVGSSGLATGPHLHYEFRINGVHRNPLTVPLPSALPIARKYRTDFSNTADTMISQLKSRKLATIALTEQ